MAMRYTTGYAVVAVAALLALAGCKPGPKEGVARGRVLWDNCATCHGEDGSGKAEIEAPGIAGMPEWYVQAQLEKFRSGARGAHPDDLAGLRMRPMSRSLQTKADVKSISQFVAQMPAVAPKHTVEGGDATKGQALYAVCSACHGPDAAGNPALEAPPLAGSSDWYMLSQLKKFKTGVRGRNAQDTTGAQMAPMAATLTDEQAMKDVVAYIKSKAK